MVVLDLDYLELLVSPDNNKYFISGQASLIKILIQPKVSSLYSFPVDFDPTTISIDFTDFHPNFHLIEINSDSTNINMIYNNSKLQFTLTKENLVANACIVFTIIFYDILDFGESNSSHSFDITFNGNIIPYNYFINSHELYGVYLVNGDEKLHTSQVPLRLTDVDAGYGDNITLNTQNISIFEKNLINKSIDTKNFKIGFKVMNQSSYELIEEKIRSLYNFLINPFFGDALKLFFDYNRDEYYNVHYTGQIEKKYDRDYATFQLNFTSVDGSKQNEHSLFKSRKGFTMSYNYISPIILLKSNVDWTIVDIDDVITGTRVEIMCNEGGVKLLIMNTKTFTVEAYDENGARKEASLYINSNIYLLGEYELIITRKPPDGPVVIDNDSLILLKY